LRSAITTDAPAPCSRRTVAAPSPDAPPATRVLDPSILMGAAGYPAVNVRAVPEGPAATTR
jgi:hypothetical protein